MAQRNMRQRSDDDLHADWVRWIQRAYDESVRQAWRHRNFRLLRAIADQNERLRECGGFFLQWAADNYVAASAIAFRRELDTQSGTENLYHLLVELRDRPQVLNRARFRSSWQGTTEYWTADRAFEQYQLIPDPDDRDRDHLNPDTVRADLDRLSTQDHVLEYVQTKIAHRVPVRPNAPMPTFGDFHEAITVVQEVVSRYYTLLTHSHVASFEPAAQFNVYEPFRSAWIANPEKFDYGAAE